MHHLRHLAFVYGLLFLVFAGPSWAQTWRGSEAIEIQATDSKGKPIVGGRVVVTFQARGSQNNPPEVATDQKGRAVVADLAIGSWQVEVKHPDFLSYVAVFDLQRGKKPSISASFLEAGGGSLTPMKVKLSKGNPRNASPPLPAREARAQAPPPVEAEAVPAAPAAGASRDPEPSPEVEPTPQAVTATPPQAQPEARVVEPAETPSAVELPPASEEPPTRGVEVEKAPEPSATPEPEPTRQELPTPPTASPTTAEAPVQIAPEPATRAEPTLEPESREPEPLQPSDVSVEPITATAEPAKPEPSETAEPAAVIADAPPATPSEPAAVPAEMVEEEPAVEVAQVPSAPMEPQTEPLPAEPTGEVVTPAEISDEAVAPQPVTKQVPPRVEEVEAKAPAAAAIAPIPAPAARGVVPADTPTIASYRDGSCSDCRNGEWAVTATQPVAAGTVPCPADVSRAGRDAAESLGNSMQLELSGFVGPVADGSGTEALVAVESEIAQAYQQRLAPYLRGASNCQVVSVVLPKSVRFVGFRYEAFDERGGGECAPDSGCPLQQAQWLANPVVQRGFNATVVWGIFESTTAQSPRAARLKVYFRPPNASWHPPSR